jgi:hypothetical protein
MREGFVVANEAGTFIARICNDSRRRPKATASFFKSLDLFGTRALFKLMHDSRHVWSSQKCIEGECGGRTPPLRLATDLGVTRSPYPFPRTSFSIVPYPSFCPESAAPPITRRGLRLCAPIRSRNTAISANTHTRAQWYRLCPSHFFRFDNLGQRGFIGFDGLRVAGRCHLAPKALYRYQFRQLARHRAHRCDLH